MTYGRIELITIMKVREQLMTNTECNQSSGARTTVDKQAIDEKSPATDKVHCSIPVSSGDILRTTSEGEQGKTLLPKRVKCSSCTKLIINPIAEGHRIEDGHVGRFRMLVPWVKETDGFLCSRCYQRNWRLNKQQSGPDEKDSDEVCPRTPYKCICGMTFQSSQFKAAHCKQCPKFRELADQKQHQEGTSTSPKPKNAQKRPRSDSELHQSPHSPKLEMGRDHSEGLPSAHPSPVKAQDESATTSSVVSSSALKGCSSLNAMLNSQKIQLAQLLHTTLLIGQIDVQHYSSLAQLVASTTDPDILTNISQVVLEFALKPSVATQQQQFIPIPPTKFVGVDANGRPLLSWSYFQSMMSLLLSK